MTYIFIRGIEYVFVQKKCICKDFNEIYQVQVATNYTGLYIHYNF